MGDGMQFPSPIKRSASNADSHQRRDDVIETIEKRIIDRIDISECRCYMETSARLASRTESRGIPKPTRLAARTAALGEVEHDAGSARRIWSSNERSCRASCESNGRTSERTESMTS